jgi:uroporphyrinogen decarboxylase
MTAQGFRERPKDDRTGKDWFGIDWIYDATCNAPIPDPKRKPLLGDITEWKGKVKFPDLDAWDWESHIKDDHLEQFDRENNLLSVWVMCGPFERLHDFLGFEEALISIVSEPEATAELISAIIDHKCKLLEKIFKYYKPDMIQFHDDWGNQQNLFFAPELWRKIIKPQIKRVVDVCHKHGVIYEQHSCGKVEKIIPDLAEIGVDAVFIMGINDIPKCKAITGNKLAYVVQIKYQEYNSKFLTGVYDEEALRSAVREDILANAKGGNYSVMAVPIDFVTGKPDAVCAITFDEIMKNIDNMTQLITAK